MIEVKNKFNQLNEATFFLYSIAQDINFEKLKMDSSHSVFGKEMYEKILDTIIYVQNTIRNRLGISKERIDFYFKPINENDLSMDCFVMQYDYSRYDETLIETMKRVRKQTDEDRLIEYTKLVLEYHVQGNLEEVNQIHNLSDFINILSESNFSDENKMRILKIYSNKEKYEDEVEKILSKTIAILDELKDKYQWIEKFCYDYWISYGEKYDIRKVISQNSNVAWENNSNGIIIQPMLSLSTKFSISIADEAQKKDVIRIGVLMDENFRCRTKAANIDEIVNIIKILGDKSKLDIIDLIKDKSAYGKELADELGLAKGTISHHMSILTSIGMIDTVCEANRIYYKLNKKRFEQIFDELKEYFVDNR